MVRRRRKICDENQFLSRIIELFFGEMFRNMRDSYVQIDIISSYRKEFR